MLHLAEILCIVGQICFERWIYHQPPCRYFGQMAKTAKFVSCSSDFPDLQTFVYFELIFIDFKIHFHQVKILFVFFQPPKCDEKSSDKVQILLHDWICDHLYTYLWNGLYSYVIIFIKVFVSRTHCLCNVQVFLLV